MLHSTGSSRLTRTHRLAAAGVAAVGAAALSATLVPGVSSGAESKAQEAKPASAQAGKPASAQSKIASFSAEKSYVPSQRSGSGKENHVAGRTIAEGSVANRQAAVAEEKAEKDRAAKAAASRKAKRAAVKSYPNNLDGWIREARAIMKKHGIPGSYWGIKRNIIRESGGDPNAVNDWDINAKNGVPSKGLLQVIKPTFDAYHVKGTKYSQTDPVANIVAACNYAADRYGSMDNVNSAY